MLVGTGLRDQVADEGGSRGTGMRCWRSSAGRGPRKRLLSPAEPEVTQGRRGRVDQRRKLRAGNRWLDLSELDPFQPMSSTLGGDC